MAVPSKSWFSWGPNCLMASSLLTARGVSQWVMRQEMSLAPSPETMPPLLLSPLWTVMAVFMRLWGTKMQGRSSSIITFS